MEAFARSKLACSILAVLGAGLLWADPAAGQPFNVTKTADTADGTCDADCSLREAIIAANANPGADIVNVPASMTPYTITLTGAETDFQNDATMRDLDITGEVTIDGAGPTSTIIDAQDVDRIFHIHGGPVSITDLTIQDGTSEAGGGIFVTAVVNLSLTNVVVTQNVSTGAAGGGIRYGAGTLMITDSTVSDNMAPEDQGGGIFIPNGTVTILRSTISGNTSGESGGGVRIDAGTVSIQNSTISGNTGNSGGGIRNLNGNVTVTNTTISGNGAGSGSGGGIGSFDPTEVTISGSIIANNTAATSPDCTEINSGGFNLIENTTGCTIGGTTTGNVTGMDPQLQGLAPNGGPTQTHALSGTSPALNALTSGCPPPATDQRGTSRAQGAACEIGSFECSPTECGGAVPTSTVTATATATGTPAATSTPSVTGTPTSTPSVTNTPTASPTRSSTATPTVTRTPTSTRTPGPVIGPPEIPTLSAGMLAFLGLGLASAALWLVRRR